jgi:hypothetical protein
VVEPLDVVHGRWWRFSAYEIEGWHIRPCADAELEEYDPWAEYFDALNQPSRTHRAGKRASEPPYVTLSKLLSELPFHEGSEGEASALLPEGRRRIADWCSRHGLLGILPQRARQVVLAPVLDDDGNGTQTRYWRTPDRGWLSATDSLRPRRPERHGRVTIRRPELPEPMEPHGVLYDLQRGEEVVEPLEGIWATYFPGVRADARGTFQYPQPLSPDFWRGYAEHLHDFLDAAWTLHHALRMLHEAREPTEPDDDPARIARFELRRMNRLMDSVTPFLAFDAAQRTFHQRWSSPSLLASFALMASLDLTQKRVRACAECGALFVTEAYQTRYCRPEHSERARKRAYRARRRKRDDSGQQNR